MKVTPINKEKKTAFSIYTGNESFVLTVQQMITLQALLQKELNNIKF